MLIIHIKHYLNDQGIKFFDVWFEKVFGYISKKEGFLLLERAFDNNNQECVHIWLHFRDRETLKAWAQSDEHNQIVRELDSYRTASWEATWYNTEKAEVEHHIIPLDKY